MSLLPVEKALKQATEFQAGDADVCIRGHRVPGSARDHGRGVAPAAACARALGPLGGRRRQRARMAATRLALGRAVSAQVFFKLSSLDPSLPGSKYLKLTDADLTLSS